jgi:hypothetical protein
MRPFDFVLSTYGVGSASTSFDVDAAYPAGVFMKNRPTPKSSHKPHHLSRSLAGSACCFLKVRRLRASFRFASLTPAASVIRAQ